MAAKLDGNIIGLILLRFELDKSSLLSALQRKHVMVVDCMSLAPHVSSARCSIMIDAGIKHTVAQLAACRGMRIEFCPQP